MEWLCQRHESMEIGSSIKSGIIVQNKIVVGSDEGYIYIF